VKFVDDPCNFIDEIIQNPEKADRFIYQSCSAVLHLSSLLNGQM